MAAGNEQTVEQVRSRYAAAALTVTATGRAVGDPVTCCGRCGGDVLDFVEAGEGFGSQLYDDTERAGLPDAAILASLGCGNPTAVVELRVGETVLDLGSGGGLDVLLSAKRVGTTGKVYGLDMTEEMLVLARANAKEAGAMNVEFLRGRIEAIPLPDASVDVIISNCVVNLSTDKPAVLAEIDRILCPGGRVGISDVVAEGHLTPEDRAARGSHVGCIAGALSITEYLDGLDAVGLLGATVDITHHVADGMHGAIIRASKPACESPASLAACGSA